MPPKSKADSTTVKQSHGTFTLPNGDRYDGEFLANSKTKSVVRNGLGTYQTWDGHRYTGSWENDAFAKGQVVRIEFDDYSVYTGKVSNQMDYLGGTYQFHDGSQMKCAVFGKSGVPTEAADGGDGEGLEFTDPTGVIWDRAMADQWLVVRHPGQFNANGGRGGGGDGDGGGGGDGDDH